ncbi:MAG: SUMF1/EgtB/PvdO family nonheme iron enzyme [Cyanobacteria bacterium P01_A01_bin.123]
MFQTKTRIVQIYRREHRLPVIRRDLLQARQKDIHQRCQFMQEGRPTFLGLSRKPLTVDESIETLDSLIADYELMIRFIENQKASYTQFFSALVDEIKEITAEKYKKIAALEKKRTSLAERAGQDCNLQRIYSDQRDQLLRTAHLIGCASLLMLKKLALIQNALTNLASDQEVQRQVLNEMLSHLSIYAETHQLQKEISAIQQEAADMANMAIDFEEYVGKYLGSLQEMINQVVKLDQKLSVALQEIKGLTDIILGGSEEYSIDDQEGASTQIINWLTQSALKQDRLTNALKDVEDQTLSDVEMDFQLTLENTGSESVTETLAKIQAHLDSVFTTHISTTHTSQTPPEEHPSKPNSSASVMRKDKTVIPEKSPTRSPNLATPSCGQQWRQGQSFTEDLGSNIDIKMTLVSGGRFLMGSPVTEPDRDRSEGPQHAVTVLTFLIGRYPVTQAQWRRVAKMPPVKRQLDLDPSFFKGRNHPVEEVSWYEAVEFCDRLSRYSGHPYRLPSEAEWEYACRAGTLTPFHCGETLIGYANYDGANKKYAVWGSDSRSKRHEGTTPIDYFGGANEYGLCDMHGNVFEWCQDYWHTNYNDAPTDGSARLSCGDSSCRVIRGGSWLRLPKHCRSAYRFSDYPDFRYRDVGFRVACSALTSLQQQPQSEEPLTSLNPLEVAGEEKLGADP